MTGLFMNHYRAFMTHIGSGNTQLWQLITQSVRDFIVLALLLWSIQKYLHVNSNIAQL